MTLKSTWAAGDTFTADDQNAVSDAVNGLSESKEDKANRNVPNGYAGLDASGVVGEAQLPDLAAQVADPESTLRVALDTWYQKVSPISFTVTIPAGKVSATLAGFPVYINLADMPDAFWGKVAAGGGGIRCYAGTVELAREVVSCDPATKTGELHVKADLSATAATALLVTVDGVSPDYAPTDPFGRNAVWADYAAVWHLAESTGAYLDSSSSGVNSTSMQVASRSDAGKLGGGAALMQESDNIKFGSNLGIDTGNMSLSAWVNTTDATAGAKVIFNRGSKGYRTYLNNGTLVTQLINGTDPVISISTTGPLVNNGVWHLLQVTIDRSGSMTAYVDGAVATAPAGNNPKSVASMAGQDLTDPAGIFGLSDFGSSFIGLLDEVRIIRNVLSSARIAAEYANQNNPAGFYSIARAG